MGKRQGCDFSGACRIETLGHVFFIEYLGAVCVNKNRILVDTVNNSMLISYLAFGGLGVHRISS